MRIDPGALESRRLTTGARQAVLPPEWKPVQDLADVPACQHRVPAASSCGRDPTCEAGIGLEQGTLDQLVAEAWAVGGAEAEGGGYTNVDTLSARPAAAGTRIASMIHLPGRDR